MRNPFAGAAKSIRARLFLGIAVMLLPLLAFGSVSLLFSRIMLDAVDRIVQAGLVELVPVTELQKLILQSAMPPNDYLILGRSSEKTLFEKFTAKTDRKFSELIVSPNLQEEYALLAEVRKEWEAAKKAGWLIFSFERPVGNRAAGLQMKVFDEHIARSAELMDKVYDSVYAEIDGHLAEAYRIRRVETYLLFFVFFLAAMSAAGAAFVLSRSLLGPIHALQDGMMRFSEGDHSFRVAMERPDEFGQLAQTMNSMAERLEHDSLTGVYNRREFTRKIRLEIERSSRYRRTFSLLMVDIDHFKAVNDTYGHQAGDEVLRAVTMLILKDLRAADILARYGGEEFVVIMPETPGPMAAAVAGRIRSHAEAQPHVTTKGQSIGLTVSIGIATFPADARQEDELIAAADKALYEAKQNGRNRVVQYRA